MSLLNEWLRKAASDRGSTPAVVYRDTYLSWRGLEHRVARRAQELEALGLAEGELVGVMLGNVPDFVILGLALAKLGAIMVPIDPSTGVRDLDLVHEVLPLRALITRPHGEIPPSSGGSGGPRAPSRPPNPTSRHAPESKRRLQGTLLQLALFRRDPAELPPGCRVALMTCDAGGDPKAVLRADAQLESTATALIGPLGVGANDQILAATPCHQAAGYDAGLLVALCANATLHLDDETSPKRLSKFLRDHVVDVLVAPPSAYGHLARLPATRPLTGRGQRFLATGAALPVAAATAFAERFAVRPLSLYHLTEAGPVALDRDGAAPSTVGMTLPGVHLELGDRGHAGASADAVWVRSPSIGTHLLPGLPAALRQSTTPIGRLDADGWLRTGDRGVRASDGRLTLVGREDDLVKIDGKRIALGEIAACLESFPRVKEAEARVRVDELGEPQIVARVVCTTEIQIGDLMDHCTRALAPHKVPRHVEVRDAL